MTAGGQAPELGCQMLEVGLRLAFENLAGSVRVRGGNLLTATV